MRSGGLNDPGQPARALANAQRIRMEGVAVKREITAGALSVADALADPRAGSLTVMAVLMAQHRWARHRAARALRAAETFGPSLLIAEDRRVRDLTDRQRYAIVAAVKPGAALGRAA